MHVKVFALILIISIISDGALAADNVAAKSRSTDFLVTGKLRPAFDHLGGVDNQVDSLAASGCTVNFGGGTLGSLTYLGLSTKVEIDKVLEESSQYNSKGHTLGVPIMLSYLCATSIVNADTFTRNWKDYAPGLPDGIDAKSLLQQDINGNNLPSWYGGQYNPADMWNPVWRQYQKFCIKLAIESGHDGVFYDNPTVHPQGNYSDHAMRAWSEYLKSHNVKVEEESVQALRQLTKVHPALWMQFRTIEAAAFFQEMRDYGRSLKPDFILTANNSLNSWDSFYFQPRYMGYSIFQKCQSEDFIVVEDQAMSPRLEGATYISYASTIRMVNAIGHGKPLVVCTIAQGDYITPPNMMKLAIAECTAHDAAYMVWACWDKQYCQSNEQSVKSYHDFLVKHADLFTGTTPLSDAMLIWPYDNWQVREDCPTAFLAQYLSANNIQYDPVIENDLIGVKWQNYRNVIWAAGEAPRKDTTQKMISSFTKSGAKALEVPTDRTLPASRLSCDRVPYGQNLDVVFDGNHFTMEDAEKEKLAIAAHRNLGAPDNTFTSSDEPSSHWVGRQWPSPQTIGRIVIWWGDKSTWPVRYQVRGIVDGRQQTLISKSRTGWRSVQSQCEEIALDTPVNTSQIFVVMDACGGRGKNPKVMMIQEVEAYAPNSDVNIAKLDKAEDPALAKTIAELAKSSSVNISSVPGVRTSVRKSRKGFLLHLYNLGVIRQDSYHDKVDPAGKVEVSWLLPKGVEAKNMKLNCLTPDTEGFLGKLAFKQSKADGRTRITFTVPKLHIWSVIYAEPERVYP